jgi:hypothetical protein
MLRLSTLMCLSFCAVASAATAQTPPSSSEASQRYCAKIAPKIEPTFKLSLVGQTDTDLHGVIECTFELGERNGAVGPSSLLVTTTLTRLSSMTDAIAFYESKAAIAKAQVAFMEMPDMRDKASDKAFFISKPKGEVGITALRGRVLFQVEVLPRSAYATYLAGAQAAALVGLMLKQE